MTLVQVTPPAAIISATDAKARVPALAGLTDAQVDWAIASATADAEYSLGRAFGVQTWDYSLDAGLDRCSRWWTTYGTWWGPYIELPLPPLISVDEIHYLDSEGTETLWPDDQYRPSGVGGKGRISLASGGSWPTSGAYPEALRITFTAGYATVPADIVQAILLMAGDQSALAASASSSSSGGLKRIVTEGVGSREYYQESSSSSSSSSGSKAAQRAVQMLEKYRVYG